MLTLNLTLLMGKSSEGLIVSAEVDIDGKIGHTHGIYCHRSDRELLCEVGVKSVVGFLRSLIHMFGCHTLSRIARPW